MKKCKKILAICLVFLLTISSICMDGALIKSSAFSDEFVAEKIYDLYNKIGGEGAYFNTGRNACCGEKSSGHACPNCLDSNIFKTQWFINLFGKVNSNQLPEQYNRNGTIGSRDGYSCYGFAAFAAWYIFHHEQTDVVNTQVIGKFNLDKKSCFENVKPGDILRLNESHSVVVIQVNSNGVEIIDSNAVGDYNCQIHIRTLSYSEIEFVISRPIPLRNCSCNCHKTGFIKSLWKIINFFHKIFGMKQYQYCDCGDKHW